VKGGAIRSNPCAGIRVARAKRQEPVFLRPDQVHRLAEEVANPPRPTRHPHGAGTAKGVALVALDVGVDTTSPAGEMLANVLASFAQYERRIIGQRTRDALAEKRRQGVRLGRPRDLSDGLVARLVAQRSAGDTLAQIAEMLNTEGVPTSRGGRRWYDSTVRNVLGYAAGTQEPKSQPEPSRSRM
jgi:hypothetical protein